MASGAVGPTEMVKEIRPVLSKVVQKWLQIKLQIVVNVVCDPVN